MPTMGNETLTVVVVVLAGFAGADLIGRRFGEGFLFMMVVPAVWGSGTPGYAGRIRRWRGFVVENHRHRRRPRSRRWER